MSLDLRPAFDRVIMSALLEPFLRRFARTSSYRMPLEQPEMDSNDAPKDED